MVLGTTPFSSPCTNSRDLGKEPGFHRAVRSRRESDERVQRDFHPWAFFLVTSHVVRVDAPQDRLMRDDQNILTAFELHYYRLQPDHNIAV